MAIFSFFIPNELGETTYDILQPGQKIKPKQN